MSVCVTVQPELTVDLCAKTKVLPFLLRRTKVKEFTENKLYASEILSILLQADSANQAVLSSTHVRTKGSIAFAT